MSEPFFYALPELAQKHHHMICPNCNETLVISERHGIEIDYCPNCRGVWLDRGELDKIIERAVEDVPKRALEYPYPEREDMRPPRDKEKKRKSFLGDLFDY